MAFKNNIILIRNKVIAFLYKYILKPIFFCFDPEVVHDRMILFGKFLGKYKITRLKTKILFNFYNKKLEQNIFGIKFKNPVGLSAGFDKDAELLDIIPNVGFGFEEIGSITGFPCKGNPKPRLWRLKKSKSLTVYYGLKSRGSDYISNVLNNKKFEIPIFTNIAMTNNEENLDINRAISDYIKSFKSLSNIGDFFTLNISCPNTCGGQPFMEEDNLDRLLSSLDELETKKPIFVKISPDISFEKLDLILNVLKKHKVQGIVCSNLTKQKESPFIFDMLPPKGGISGKPLQKISDDLIAHIYKREGKRFIIVGVGGIFNAEDAYRKIRNGASLVGMITGLIFEGPQVVSDINLGLLRILERDGFKNISEAVGVDVK